MINISVFFVINMKSAHKDKIGYTVGDWNDK